MKARKFNGFVMPWVNEEWAAKVLGLIHNKHNGIDLIGRCVMEVKFSLSHYPAKWTVLEYQMDYQELYPGKNAYWGIGTYTLSVPVSKIKTKDPTELEKLVTKRELRVVPWGWMAQFPPHKTSGQTDKSEWENTLRYPRGRLIPRTTISYEVEKGIVHLTEDVDKNDFLFLEDGIPI
ncbi:MAG: hypothetical protein KGH55_02025 [Nanoarchaeota archaeon]|nr:hypothetical protein [Nanoarchaeota archaeon]